MKKVIPAFFSLLVVCSCSMMKLGYNNADWLLTWKIDDFFDLTSDQKDFVEERLEVHLLWHRNNELPRYSKIIDEMIYRVEKGISGDDYEWAISELQGAYKRAISEILPDATTLLMNLEPAQIKYYEEQVAERYEEHADEPERSEEEHKQRRSDRIINRLEEWFGELDPIQKEKIKELSHTLPLRNNMYREDRQRRNDEFISLLKSDLVQDEFMDRLRIHFTDFDSGRSEEYKQATTAFNEASKNMAVKISQIITQEQKEQAFKKIRAYQIDFTELAANQ